MCQCPAKRAMLSKFLYGRGRACGDISRHRSPVEGLFVPLVATLWSDDDDESQKLSAGKIPATSVVYPLATYAYRFKDTLWQTSASSVMIGNGEIVSSVMVDCVNDSS